MAQTVLPWSKSLGECRSWPINTWKWLHLSCSEHMTRPQGLPKYRVVGLGCLVLSSHQAQIFLSSPHPCRTAAQEYLWLTEKSPELTWLLSMMLSHRIEKRSFCCAWNLWETRAAQCKGLGNFSFVFDTRPVRFVCNWVWQWLSVCLHSADLWQMIHDFGKMHTFLLGLYRIPELSPAAFSFWWLHFWGVLIFFFKKFSLIQKSPSLQFAVSNSYWKQGSGTSSITPCLKRSGSGSDQHIWFYSLIRWKKHYGYG